MPITSVAGASTQALQELAKTAQKPAGEKNFGQVLQKGANPSQQNNIAGPVNQTTDVKNANQTSSPLQSLFNSMSKSKVSMNNLLKEAMTGQNMSPGKLLVLQSRVYSYTTNIEALSKVVETGTNAIKTTMQTQV